MPYNQNIIHSYLSTVPLYPTFLFIETPFFFLLSKKKSPASTVCLPIAFQLYLPVETYRQNYLPCLRQFLIFLLLIFVCAARRYSTRLFGVGRTIASLLSLVDSTFYLHIVLSSPYSNLCNFSQ